MNEDIHQAKGYSVWFLILLAPQQGKKIHFHSGPHEDDWVLKVPQCLLAVFIIVQEWRSLISLYFLYFLVIDWKSCGGTPNFRFSFSWLFVSRCGLRDWFSPSCYIDETPPLGSSGNSSCADNFELSYLVTVQTRVNAQICFRCLSLHGSISSCFCFQGYILIDAAGFRNAVFLLPCWSLWLNLFHSSVEEVIHMGWLTSKLQFSWTDLNVILLYSMCQVWFQRITLALGKLPLEMHVCCCFGIIRTHQMVRAIA